MTSQYKKGRIKYRRVLTSAFSFDLCRPVFRNRNCKREHHHWLPQNPILTIDANAKADVTCKWCLSVVNGITWLRRSQVGQYWKYCCQGQHPFFGWLSLLQLFLKNQQNWKITSLGGQKQLPPIIALFCYLQCTFQIILLWNDVLH